MLRIARQAGCRASVHPAWSASCLAKFTLSTFTSRGVYCITATRQVNRLDRDNGGLRAENNRLATIVAERQPLVDTLRDTIDDLREVVVVAAHTS